MLFLVRLIRRFASERDRGMLDEDPSLVAHLRVTGRIVLRHAWVYVLLLLPIAAFAFSMGMDVYHRTEAPAFCGSCHEMDAQKASWEVSRHGSVKCVDCHARPGIGGYAAAKLGGLKQMYKHVTSGSITDISMGDDDLQIVSENCLRCHPGASRLDERGGIAISHQGHLKNGVRCVDCHSGRFAHPEPGKPAPDRVTLASHADCYGCHDGKRQVAGKTVFDARAEESCTRCHLDSVAVWDHGGQPWKDEDRKCLSCHDPVADQNHFALRGKGELEVCSKCHENLHDSEELVSTHKPFKEGKCDDCHRVMSPLHLFRDAPGPTVTFCISCHEDAGLRLQGKPAKTASHFVNGTKDLHRKHGKMLDGPRWCLTCHDSHGSDASRAMIRLHKDTGEVDPAGKYEATLTGGSCTGACHEEATEYEFAAEEASAGEGATP